MYRLTNLDSPLNKETIDEIGNTFYLLPLPSPMNPLKKLEATLNKESTDKICNTPWQSLTHVLIDEFRNPS